MHTEPDEKLFSSRQIMDKHRVHNKSVQVETSLFRTILQTTSKLPDMGDDKLVKVLMRMTAAFRAAGYIV